MAHRAQSNEPVEAVVGLAPLKVLLQPNPISLTNIDAADWLVTHGRSRKVTLVGHFPFIEGLKPAVAQL